MSFPFAVKESVEKKILPPFVVTAIVDEPWTEQLVIILFVAPPIKRIVDVPEVADTVVLTIIKLLPPELIPSNVTLSAPFKSIIGEPAVVAPEIVLVAPPTGDIVIALYNAEPVPLAFNKAVVAPSLVSPETLIVIIPWWIPEFIAVKAAFNVV